ncbi:EscU/YscU/HrcU family type III secretion system export apparatus switch protein [bacterium]|nr:MULTISPECIES: EscU/YscU/HrcU family type III secretion system export apparatus switch protein [Pirellulaceae]MDB4338590.1 EscU/YscU/HrcU family type III secretion system export apparatus switch protein [Rubripirellula sp.]MDB4678930.1 EscU/YscU/HrcU family type III secretion system export apparatus switch protein [Rhodopirellula sp.]MDC0279084.1 EscU/YscU/HrcU family type III secretion system export apparatus switch protein [bacterium]
MTDADVDKKHFATERRRRRARQEGQVVRSQDLTSAIMLIVAVTSLWMFGGPIVEKLATWLTESLSQTSLRLTDQNQMTRWLVSAVFKYALIVMPVILSLLVFGVLANVMQTGLIFSAKKINPKLSNLNPISGFARVISLQGAARLAFGFFKILVTVTVAFFSMQHDQETLLSLGGLSIERISVVLFECLTRTCMWIGIALLIMGLFEYLFQRWKHERDLMMTDKEMRDELRETEGDAQVVSRRKSVQRQLMMQRIATEVQSAQVVVTNPSEYAVAIRYDPATMQTPKLVAKGSGDLAQIIRRMALENGVVVVERKPLARALYRTAKPVTEIPREHYLAVSEVFGCVCRLHGQQLLRTKDLSS